MICAYDKCQGQKEFEPKTHNQKYCSDECCRIATNEKLKEKYYDQKARLAGKKRYCKTHGCNVQLSRYNSTKVCDKCKSEEKEKARQSLLDMVKNVSS